METREPVTLQTIADAAGVSKMTVSRVLRNTPGHSPKTRDRILRAAKTLNYQPNPLISALMAQVRQGTPSHAQQTLALIHWVPHGRPVHINLLNFREGLREQAQQLGYEVEDHHLSETGMTPERIFQILESRGIRGVVFEHFFERKLSIVFDLSKFACVGIEFSLLSPIVHRIDSDHYTGSSMAVEKALEHGFKRIGYATHTIPESLTNYRRMAGYLMARETIPEKDQIPVLNMLERKDGFERMLPEWLDRHQPEVVISPVRRLYDYLKKMGYQVPRDISFIYTDMSTGAPQYSGVRPQWRHMGEQAAIRVIDLMNRNSFGVPKAPLITLVPCEWQDGQTLGRV